MLIVILWKVLKWMFVVGFKTMRLVRPFATIQSIILVPLVVVLLLLPYFFSRGEPKESTNTYPLSYLHQSQVLGSNR
jgi:hypothetical protein